MTCILELTRWSAFTIGLFGAFIPEFVRFIRQNKTITQTFQIGESYISTSKINLWAILTSVIYIVIGGGLASLFAKTTMEALLYGGLWQTLFTISINVIWKK